MHQHHNNNFKTLQKQRNQEACLKKTEEEVVKKVSFNISEDSDKELEEKDENMKITVRDDMLCDAKTYLAQFSDFLEGGAQG